ncbi:MAG: undecaprenyl/decaprenyl-phosphate alpha-N-acetylglucosaminyl 1-phosphate transferase [Blastocatellia bacterium]|nr:undecaprenyl/decaprenyl-phosphate alpha-N-acetylglucosaminyl 1-phosphate transferase [Blastocatellia bacterium]
MRTYTLVFFTSLVASFILTPVIRNYAMRRGMVDDSTEHRKIHVGSIPRLGGIGIFLAFFGSLAMLGLIESQVAHNFRDEFPDLLRLFVPCLAMFVLGLTDDLYRLNASVKFVAQILVAICFYFFTAKIGVIANPFTGNLIDLGWLSLPITVLWLVGITNAFNLIDGIDGLAAGSSLFTALAMLCVALATNNVMVVLVICALAGGILGFLKYNFNPATVFMGDSGSLFIGFTLASLAIRGAQEKTTIIAVAIPLVSFGLPIMETLLSVLRRFLAGQPLFSADRRHIHHQLLAKGFSQRQAVIILYGASAVFAVVSLLVMSSPEGVMGLILLVFGISAWIAIQHLDYHEFGEVGRLFQRSLVQRAVMINNIRIQSILSGLAEVRTFGQLFDRLDECFRTLGFISVDIQLSPAFSQVLEDHVCFTSRFTDQGLVVTWRNTPQRTEPVKTFQLHIPYEYQVGNRMVTGFIILHRQIQEGPMLFDLNLLLNNLRQSFEQSLVLLSRGTVTEPLVNRSAQVEPLACNEQTSFEF